METNEKEIRNDIIEGRNAVIEALRAGSPIDKIFIAKGETDKTLGFIASKAREAGITVADTGRRKLDFMSVTKAHQGVIAVVPVREYCEVPDILDAAAEKGEDPFIIVCDSVSDPHNLGAIIRSAECAGAHGVIIPKRRSAGLTAVVGKASAGALEHIGSQEEGPLGIRNCSGRQERPVAHGFLGRRRSCNRLRGGRHEQAGLRKL